MNHIFPQKVHIGVCLCENGYTMIIGLYSNHHDSNNILCMQSCFHVGEYCIIMPIP